MINNLQNIIHMQGVYHGRTFGAMAAMKSKTIYSEGFCLPSACHHQCSACNAVLTTPSARHIYASPPALALAQAAETHSQMCLNRLHLVLGQVSATYDTAAIIIGSVHGEGGCMPAPKVFLKGLHAV